MNKILALFFCFVIHPSFYVWANQYHVSVNGSDKNKGTISKPFRTISCAARQAIAGDTIIVHKGIYREEVNPLHGGASDNSRIVFMAAPGERVEIKGSEIITGWGKVRKGIWKVTLPDTFFGHYNPYTDLISGDWYFGKDLHTGEVYLNGRGLYEVNDLEKVLDSKSASTPFGKPSDFLRPDYTWFCSHENGETIIYANFHNRDPNKGTVEINVRKSCFYPAQTGINYITVKGFHMSQAATQWAAPTAEQIGLIGTNWSKGWVIEDNTISDSKCVGITLGKDRKTGNNGVDYNEMVHRVIANGWNKDTIGSHLVFNNIIYNCGAAGICGSFGAAYSQIIHNNIYNIYTYRPFWGAEMGGIKIHAAIDVLIKNNRVHNTYQGIWLDWMAQGTRVSANLCYDNDYVDFFAEVNHGPYLVDNNLFLSSFSIKDWSEGGAYAHNLIAGLVGRSPQDRETPYFKPHTTEWLGIKNIMGGDNRFYNNIFIGNAGKKYSKPPRTYLPSDGIDSISGYGLKIYDDAALPVQADGNVYLNDALNFKNEVNFKKNDNLDPNFELLDEAGGLYLKTTTYQLPAPYKNKLVTSELLGKAVILDCNFENPDSTGLKIDRDYFGNMRNEDNPNAGPFEKPGNGRIIIKIW